MQSKKAINNLEQTGLNQIAERMLRGRSSVAGAMTWMFGLSFVLTLLLGWIPVIGPFIGPVIGGLFGGRRAGSVARALVAAVLPAVFMSLVILGIGALAASLASQPILGAIAAIVAATAWVIVIIHNLLLFACALVGGLTRQVEGP